MNRARDTTYKKQSYSKLTMTKIIQEAKMALSRSPEKTWRGMGGEDGVGNELNMSLGEAPSK